MDIFLWMLQYAYDHGIFLMPNTFAIADAILDGSEGNEWYYSELCYLRNINMICQFDYANEAERAQAG